MGLPTNPRAQLYSTRVAGRSGRGSHLGFGHWPCLTAQVAPASRGWLPRKPAAPEAAMPQAVPGSSARWSLQGNGPAQFEEILIRRHGTLLFCGNQPRLCLAACMHVRTYVCMYVCMYAGTDVRAYVRKRTCVRTYARMYTRMALALALALALAWCCGVALAWALAWCLVAGY